jgi:hypothetical protein
LVCLAGLPGSFRISADDILRRFSRVRLSAATARRATQEAGRRLAERQRAGRSATAGRWRPEDFALQGHRHTLAYLGLDAFSVPTQLPGGGQAEGRMLSAAVRYTPDQARGHYLADFDLDRLGAPMRQAAQALGLEQADQRIAVTDAGAGTEACIRRHFWDDLLCVLDGYHAPEHLQGYAQVRYGRDEAARQAWVTGAENIRYERGGKARVAYLGGLPVPEGADAAAQLRRLINSFRDNEHRTDYPSSKEHGGDIGSGPVEAGCKVVGDRLKRSGMRWVEAGADAVASRRALFGSGADAWDTYWAGAV